jgi:hypothetical protein
MTAGVRGLSCYRSGLFRENTLGGINAVNALVSIALTNAAR